MSGSGTLIPPSVQAEDRMTFIAAQRERLALLMSALDTEALNLKADNVTRSPSMGNMSVGSDSLGSDVGSGATLERPASAMSGLSKSRSEADFERIEHEEEERPAGAGKRTVSGGWIPWAFGGGGITKDEGIQEKKEL